MADFVYRVSGTVAYNDGSWDPFEVSVQNGLVHTPFSAFSQEAFRQAYASTAANKKTTIDALLALFVGPTHTLTPDAPATSKTVTDITMEVSGLVAHNDNTITNFSAQHSFSTSTLHADETLSGSATKTYDHIIATTAWNALVDSALEVLTGTSKATITT